MNTKHLAVLLIFTFFSTKCTQDSSSNYPNKEISINSSDAVTTAQTIENEVNLIIDSSLQVNLWASDELIKDPVAISFDTKGNIYYASANRLENSEFDIRGHKDWMTSSLSFQTVEDRRNFLRSTFSETNEQGEKFLKDLNNDGTKNWRDLTVEKEQIWYISDTNRDGVAEKAKLYIEDFHQEISDLANGVEFTDGKVFITSGPDMWCAEDIDNDGIADKLESISHGYAVHIGFGAHSMSGAIRGPDGRMYWGIGDIGANVTDQEGNQWKYPNQGVIARSELDGSGFEIFCSGLRNTHEFVFDKYGNLISEDNDGDHSGERERLVYLINGSDSGWRINWQFGKYTDPKNNKYKVWMDEKMHTPHWEGQAAYFLPPIANYINGPTGMVYNPGTALGPEWEDHFFIAEFVGTASGSPIHAFTLEPDGASFQLKETKEIVKGILPTGLDFGPDGALYAADWIKGWGHKDEGRIWKIDVAKNSDSGIRKETQYLLEVDFSKLKVKEIGTYLSHQDMRVRQKSQFALVDREGGIETLLKHSTDNPDQLARIHAIWGIAQFARLHDIEKANTLLPLLQDPDSEIVTQVARMLGDIKYQKAEDQLVELLNTSNPRLQMVTIEALGRIKSKNALPAILEAIKTNDDKDLWIRHAAMIALGRIGDDEALANLSMDPSKALKTAAVVALRRMKSPKVATFLTDQDPFIVNEAARAINDDFSILEALPILAQSLEDTPNLEVAYIRRALNANLRIGGDDAIERIVKFIETSAASDELIKEAIQILSFWNNPSVLDRVTGRYRGELSRPNDNLLTILTPRIGNLLKSNNDEILTATIALLSSLDINSYEAELKQTFSNSASSKVKSEIIKTLNSTKAKDLNTYLKLALDDPNELVRSTALRILPESNISNSDVAELLSQVAQNGSIVEKQTVMDAISTINSPESTQVLDNLLDKMTTGNLEPEVHLDLIEAIQNCKDLPLQSKMTAYLTAKDKGNPLEGYMETLVGGNIEKGKNIFYNDQTAQCIKCHAVWEYGGNAGPLLDKVGQRLSKENLLSSLILPNANYAPGYEVLLIELQNGNAISGVIESEDDNSLTLKIGGNETKKILKSNIKTRETLPSSMPGMKDKMTKKQIRDMVAFLSSL